jgi:ribosomal protein S18 acetylase RimI-like enzyme
MIMMTRQATPDDVPDLVRIINDAYRIEDFFVDGNRTHEDDVRAKLSIGHGTFLVVDDEPMTSLAGAVYVEVRGTRGYFAMLSVAPSQQGRGIGRALVAAVEAHCRAAGCEWLDLEVVDLRPELPGFYSPLGFAPIGTAPFPDPKKLKRPAHLVVMTKTLTTPPAARHRAVSQEP